MNVSAVIRNQRKGRGVIEKNQHRLPKTGTSRGALRKDNFPSHPNNNIIMKYLLSMNL